MASIAEQSPPGDMSRDAYRRWAEALPLGRYQRVDRRVVAMDRKAVACQAVADARLPCHVYPHGMTVDLEEGGNYEPDCRRPLR